MAVAAIAARYRLGPAPQIESCSYPDDAATQASAVGFVKLEAAADPGAGPGALERHRELRLG